MQYPDKNCFMHMQTTVLNAVCCIILRMIDLGQHAKKTSFLTDVSWYTISRFDPHLMYMHNKPCSDCGCQLLICLVINCFHPM